MRRAAKRHSTRSHAGRTSGPTTCDPTRPNVAQTLHLEELRLIGLNSSTPPAEKASETNRGTRRSTTDPDGPRHRLLLGKLGAQRCPERSSHAGPGSPRALRI